MKFSGAIDRAVARLVALVPLLLIRHRDRDALLAALSQHLVLLGWEDAALDGLSGLKRDLQLLKTLELLTFDPGRTAPPRPGPSLPLWATPAEARALVLGADTLEQLGLPEATVLHALIARIPKPVIEATEEARVRLDGSLAVADSEIWHNLQRAIATGRQVRLTYQKPNHAPEAFVVDRAQMIRMTNAWYFTAFRPSYAVDVSKTSLWRCVREYRLDRIQAAEVLSQSVTLPELPHFEARVVLGAELRERLFPLFDASGRPVLRVRPLEDGTMAVALRETSLLRATQRIASYGAHLVRVEEPDELRVALRAAFAKALSNLGDEA